MSVAAGHVVCDLVGFSWFFFSWFRIGFGVSIRLGEKAPISARRGVDRFIGQTRGHTPRFSVSTSRDLAVSEKERPRSNNSKSVEGD